MEPVRDDVIDIVIGGDKNIAGPLGDACALAWDGWNLAPDSCVNAYQYHELRRLDVWPGPSRNAAGDEDDPFPGCGGCAAVPHAYAQNVASCDPLPAWWDPQPRDLYYEIARHVSPAYGGIPVSPGEYPLGAPPSARQLAVSSVLTAFVRHVWLDAAHELGHALGVPEFERFPYCHGTLATDNAVHNIDVDRSEPVGTPFANRDTRVDLMDEFTHTADTGLSGYSYPGPPSTNSSSMNRFQDSQCDANDEFCPASPTLPWVHPLSKRDITISNR